MQKDNNETTELCGHATVAIELLQATKRIDPIGVKETKDFLIEHLLLSIDSEIFDDVDHRRKFSNGIARLKEIERVFENMHSTKKFHAIEVGSEIIKQGILKLQSQEVAHA